MNQEIKTLGIILLVIAILGGGLYFIKKSKTTTPVDLTSIEGDKTTEHARGDLASKVTIVEFADFQCPACGAEFPIIEQLNKDYGSKIKFVFRHFPLSMHPNAIPAAVASEAANEQGKFWEMYSALYAHQLDWSKTPNPRETFIGYAKDIGLDVSAFTKAYDANQYENRIKTDLESGNALGVNATPTFFINGKKIVGGMTLEKFKSEIDAASK